MKTDWIIRPLVREDFASILSASESELQTQGIQVHFVDLSPGFPCRVSLRDLPVGETALDLNFQHHTSLSSYRASGAVFIGSEAKTAFLVSNEIPDMLKTRPLSLRSYDASSDMVWANVVHGTEVESIVDSFFENEDVREIHIHFAPQGCYACRVERL